MIVLLQGPLSKHMNKVNFVLLVVHIRHFVKLFDQFGKFFSQLFCPLSNRMEFFTRAHVTGELHIVVLRMVIFLLFAHFFHFFPQLVHDRE